MGIRVLFADPFEELLPAYRSFFAEEGFSVATTTDGPGCLAELSSFRPDVLVLEPDMPEGWGERIVETLRDGAEVSSVPVIVLTRRSDMREQLGCAFPIHGVHVKPFSMRRLASCIRSVVGETLSE